jgi:cell division septation protein DedD
VPASFLAAAATKVMEAPAALAEMVSDLVSPPKPGAASARNAKPAKRAASAQLAKAQSNAVVQLGAYRSRERVSVAWNLFTKRYPGLSAYAPVVARFDGPKGTVYRLSMKGFASQKEAIARCNQLRGRGGSCFVRSVAGDAPVQFASR